MTGNHRVTYETTKSRSSSSDCETVGIPCMYRVGNEERMARWKLAMGNIISCARGKMGNEDGQ